MYHIGVCDLKTKEILREGISRYEKRHNQLFEVIFWDTIDDMIDTLFTGKNLDILFLGAQPEGTLDLEAGKVIYDELGEQGLHIIYVSDKEDIPRDVIQSFPFDALITGLEIDEVLNALDHAIRALKRQQAIFQFQVGKWHFSVPKGDVIYVECDEGNVRIVTRCGEFEYFGMKNDLFGHRPKGFISVHKSYIVNRRFVSQFTEDAIRLNDGTILPVSKSFREEVSPVLSARN